MLFTSSSKSTFGADEGTRTPTPLALVPKTSASTSSATSAYKTHNKIYNSTTIYILSSVLAHFLYHFHKHFQILSINWSILIFFVWFIIIHIFSKCIMFYCVFKFFDDIFKHFVSRNI